MKMSKQIRCGWMDGRKAKKKTLEIDGLLNRGQFAEVSYPPTVGKGSLSMKGIMDFKSRTKMME